MMSQFKIAMLFSSMLLCTACTTLSTPKTFEQLGHFQEIPLNNTIYRVSFEADPDFSYAKAQEINLVRSAQMTVQKGYDGFKVLNDPTNQPIRPQHQVVMYPPMPLPPMIYTRHGIPIMVDDDPFINRPYIVESDPVNISYTIIVFKKTNMPQDAFDAHRILETLGKKYGLDADGQPIPPTPPIKKS